MEGFWRGRITQDDERTENNVTTRSHSSRSFLWPMAGLFVLYPLK